MPSPRLAITVVAMNEERDLPRLLASVAWADELVVVDSGSRDRTRELAREAGAQVIEQPWLGDGPQKQLAADRITNSDWVLNLDADEWLLPGAEVLIRQAMAKEGVEAFELPFATYAYGRRLRFCGLRTEHHLRLFRRDKGRYDGTETHGGARVPGRVERLEGVVVQHESYDSIHDHLQKLNAYTTDVAHLRHSQGRRFSKLKTVVQLPFDFGKRFLFQLGFLDGWAGFVFCVLSALYAFLKQAKLEDAERKALPPSRVQAAK